MSGRGCVEAADAASTPAISRSRRVKNTSRKQSPIALQPATAAPRIPALSGPRAEHGEQPIEEAFEATILRLDGTAAERLFRRASR